MPTLLQTPTSRTRRSRKNDPSRIDPLAVTALSAPTTPLWASDFSGSRHSNPGDAAVFTPRTTQSPGSLLQKTSGLLQKNRDRTADKQSGKSGFSAKASFLPSENQWANPLFAVSNHPCYQNSNAPAPNSYRPEKKFQKSSPWCFSRASRLDGPPPRQSVPASGPMPRHWPPPTRRSSRIRTFSYAPPRGCRTPPCCLNNYSIVDSPRSIAYLKLGPLKLL
jgi:hypothetical protein